MIFSAILAVPIFRFLITEKWLPAVPYFQILCITGILYPLHNYNLNLLMVKGRSDIFLKLTVIKNFLLIIGIIIGVQFGIFGLLYAQVILSFISFFINAFYTNKFIHYSAFEQSKDIFPILLLAVIAGIAIYFLDVFLINKMDIIRILSGLTLGIIIYVILSLLFKLSSFFELKKIILRK